MRIELINLSKLIDFLKEEYGIDYKIEEFDIDNVSSYYDDDCEILSSNIEYFITSLNICEVCYDFYGKFYAINYEKDEEDYSFMEIYDSKGEKYPKEVLPSLDSRCLINKNDVFYIYEKTLRNWEMTKDMDLSAFKEVFNVSKSFNINITEDEANEILASVKNEELKKKVSEGLGKLIPDLWDVKKL